MPYSLLLYVCMFFTFLKTLRLLQLVVYHTKDIAV